MKEERISIFLESLEPAQDRMIEVIEEEAHQDKVPIIRREARGILAVLLASKRPQRVLEIGTAIGFSAILMSRHLGEGGKITTIENYEKRIVLAKENFRRAGVEEKVLLLEGDANEILPTLTEEYDFIFVDAAKGQYLSFLKDTLRLLKPGGIMVSDNVLQEGEILESRFGIERRNRTIHGRMREYLLQISQNPDLETTILPIGDGIAISVKKEK